MNLHGYKLGYCFQDSNFHMYCRHLFKPGNNAISSTNELSIAIPYPKLLMAMTP